MRKLIFVLAATASLGAMSVTADALPLVGSTAVAPAVTANSAIQKTEVVIVKKRPMRRVCKTVMTAGKRVTRCRTM